MELERRVKTLEQEMKILKNQIQTVLRDIQEQVLVHYYPSLRAGNNTAPPVEIRQEEAPDQESEASSTLPKVRQVTLDEIRNGNKHRGEAPQEQLKALLPEVEQPDALLPEAEDDWENFTRLAYWVGDSALEIGINRTKKMIELRAETGFIPPAVKDSLLQLISLCEGEGETEQGAIKETIEAFLKLNRLSV